MCEKAFNRSRRAATENYGELSQLFLLPLYRFPKLRKPQLGDLFAFAGKEVLHQPLLISAQRLQLSPSAAIISSSDVRHSAIFFCSAALLGR